MEKAARNEPLDDLPDNEQPPESQIKAVIDGTMPQVGYARSSTRHSFPSRIGIIVSSELILRSFLG